MSRFREDAETTPTPGHWIAVKGAPDDPERWAVVVDGPRRYIVATVENGAPGDCVATEGVNAHLLAAAPDLLAVVRGWIASRDGAMRGDIHGADQALRRLDTAGRAAIAKAERRAHPDPGRGDHHHADEPMSSTDLQALQWIVGRDTGVSSKTIWGVMMGLATPASRFDCDVPHDPSDFGRCHRLLILMPEWRARLPEVAARLPAWAPLVEAWDELTAMYEEVVRGGLGTWDLQASTRMYERMCELRAGGPHAG